MTHDDESNNDFGYDQRRRLPIGGITDNIARRFSPIFDIVPRSFADILGCIYYILRNVFGCIHEIIHNIATGVCHIGSATYKPLPNLQRNLTFFF